MPTVPQFRVRDRLSSQRLTTRLTTPALPPALTLSASRTSSPVAHRSMAKSSPCSSGRPIRRVNIATLSSQRKTPLVYYSTFNLPSSRFLLKRPSTKGFHDGRSDGRSKIPKNPLYIGISYNRREVYQQFYSSRSSNSAPHQNPTISESKKKPTEITVSKLRV